MVNLKVQVHGHHVHQVHLIFESKSTKNKSVQRSKFQFGLGIDLQNFFGQNEVFTNFIDNTKILREEGH